MAALLVLLLFAATELSPPPPVIDALGMSAPPPCLVGAPADAAGRLVDFVGGLLTLQLRSWQTPCEPVGGLLLEALGPTTALLSTSLVVAWPLTVALAIAQGAAAQRDGNLGPAADRALSLVTVVAHAVPALLIALLAQAAAARFGLPSFGMCPVGAATSAACLPYLTLPTASLSLLLVTSWLRPLRAVAVVAWASPGVRAARARGLTELTIARGWVLPEVLRPALTQLGLALPRLVGGVFVIEYVFGWNGMGKLMVEQAQSANLPVLVAGALLTSTAVTASRALTEAAVDRLEPKESPP